jgi:hypothetical protein
LAVQKFRYMMVPGRSGENLIRNLKWNIKKQEEY